MRIFLDDLPQHKVIVDVTHILTGIQLEGCAVHEH